MSGERAFRSGFAALVGRPNVGKSSLLNRAVGHKVAIVADKPQTTRQRIQGVVTSDRSQIVFVDTPGIHKPRHKLGAYMIRVAEQTLRDVDVILFLIDAADGVRSGDRAVAQAIHELTDVPCLLVVNKTDLLQAGELGAPDAADGIPHRLKDVVRSLGSFAETHWVSAKTGSGVETLLAAVESRLDPGPELYPAEWVTANPREFLISELVREKVLHLTRQEVPHSVAVVVDRIEEGNGWQGDYWRADGQREDGKPQSDQAPRVYVTIFVERESQKGILIGKGGSMLRRIGEQARREIEPWLDAHIFLELWVKVKPDWREREGLLRTFGYTD